MSERGMGQVAVFLVRGEYLADSIVTNVNKLLWI